MADPIIDPQRFSIVQAQLEDGGRLIAALKVQRWEVLKWAVALNLGLITAWVALRAPPSLVFTGLASGVALGAFVLIPHYNKRATGARRDIEHTFSLIEPVIKYAELGREETRKRYEKVSFFHDDAELLVFTLVLLGTVAAAYLITGR